MRDRAAFVGVWSGAGMRGVTMTHLAQHDQT